MRGSKILSLTPENPWLAKMQVLQNLVSEGFHSTNFHQKLKFIKYQYLNIV